MSFENGSNKEAAVPMPMVNVTATRTVASTKNKCILTSFDLPYITCYYNQKLLMIYRIPAVHIHDVVASMTAGLAVALQVFYPLAGRIRQDTDGVLSVEGEEGTEVFEAMDEAEAIAVDDLSGEDCPEEVEKVLLHLVPYTGVMNLEGLRRPLLAVQVSEQEASST